VNFKVYWATVGYEQNPQRYVVKVVKEALPETWTFNQQLIGNAQQTFQHQVSVEFVQVTQANIDALTFVPSPDYSVPDDFWYPFKLHSSAICSAVMGVAGALSMIAIVV